jgi:hypothetical protein
VRGRGQVSLPGLAWQIGLRNYWLTIGLKAWDQKCRANCKSFEYAQIMNYDNFFCLSCFLFIFKNFPHLNNWKKLKEENFNHCLHSYSANCSPWLYFWAYSASAWSFWSHLYSSVWSVLKFLNGNVFFSSLFIYKNFRITFLVIFAFKYTYLFILGWNAISPPWFSFSCWIYSYMWSLQLKSIA